MNQSTADEVFGPYRIRELLGRGGMGEVHRAFDTDHQRFVALKRLPAGLTSVDSYRRRFRRESAIVARLRSPHIIPIHRFGEIDGQLFLDMRLIDGTDLAATLDQTGPMVPARAVAIIEHVATALDAAHAEGVVHRDVKPSNVLLTPIAGRDFAYLADFGIARSGDDRGAALTAVGSLIGTVTYMAPERLSGDSLDARSDVYSLACVLYECLTGHQPFTSGDPARVMQSHLAVPPPSPTTARSGVPSAFDTVIATGMAKSPADRFPSAGALATAARTALVSPHGSSTARPSIRSVCAAETVTGLDPVPPPARSRGIDRVAAAVVGATVLSAAVIGAGVIGAGVTGTLTGHPPSSVDAAPPVAVPAVAVPAVAGHPPVIPVDATTAMVGCGAVPGVRSLTATTSATYSLSNRSSESVTVDWIDYGGDRRFWFTLDPGASVTEDTFTSHPWLVTRSDGTCITVFFGPGTISLADG